MQTATTEPPAIRLPSLSQQIRDWVLALPEFVSFRVADIPVGGPRLKAKVLCEMVSYDERLQRLAQGCYIRTDGGVSGLRRSYALAAMRYVGAGSGYAEGTAVRSMGWSWHSPVKHRVCVVGRPPDILFPECVFVSRSNTERRELNRAEVTLLEAFRFARFVDEDDDVPWTQAKPRLLSGDSFAPGTVIRSELLRKVARKEPMHRSKLRLLEEVVEAMPDAYEKPSSERSTDFLNKDCWRMW